MRIRPLSLLAPAVIAGSLLIAVPGPVLASDGMTQTGVTTYEVIPSKNLIQVTIKLSLHNEKPNQYVPGGYYFYYWNTARVWIEDEAGAVTATSPGGKVTQSIDTSLTYAGFRLIKFNHPNIYYGQTGVLTIKYAIPGGPGAPGGFRAGAAYASLCVLGHGDDKGSVSVILPAGFNMAVTTGDPLGSEANSADTVTYSTGTMSDPYDVRTCLAGSNPTAIVHDAVTAAGQDFDVQSWSDDPAWKTTLQSEIGDDVPKLADLTGLAMPGGTIKVLEGSDLELGPDAGSYNASTGTATLSESAKPDLVAHTLASIWFNGQTFADKWVAEGLAGYAEKVAGDGNFKPCVEPGAYPDTGMPNLGDWPVLTKDSSSFDRSRVAWQSAASCHAFTAMADAMGPIAFKSVMQGVAADEMAYLGVKPGEKLAGATGPITSQQMLDLIDELGMVPAGVEDLDQAQNLVAGLGVFDPASLDSRSKARAAYHSLATAAGRWRLPLAIRAPMSQWNFASAETAITTANQVIAARNSIQSIVPGLSLDGSIIEQKFESATSQADLNDLLALANKEIDAAHKVATATSLRDSGRSILQAIGLLGADVDTPVKGARADLEAVKPDGASSQAQTAIDLINKSVDQGTVRAGAVAGILIVLLLILTAVFFLRRRRKPAVVGALPGGPVGPDGMAPNGFSTGGFDPMTGQPIWGVPGAPATPPAGEWPPVAQPPAGEWSPVAQPPAGEWPPVAQTPAGEWPPVAQTPAGEWSPVAPPIDDSLRLAAAEPSLAPPIDSSLPPAAAEPSLAPPIDDSLRLAAAEPSLAPPIDSSLPPAASDPSPEPPIG